MLSGMNCAEASSREARVSEQARVRLHQVGGTAQADGRGNRTVRVVMNALGHEMHVKDRRLCRPIASPLERGRCCSSKL